MKLKVITAPVLFPAADPSLEEVYRETWYPGMELDFHAVSWTGLGCSQAGLVW